MLNAFGCAFHHLGLACRDLDAEMRDWTSLGYAPEGGDFVDPVQKVRGRFLTGAGPRLELLTPAAELSPLHDYIRRGTKLYHHGFLAPAFDDTLDALRKAGWKVVTGPVPAVAFDGRRIAFLMARTLNLVELIESP